MGGELHPRHIYEHVRSSTVEGFRNDVVGGVIHVATMQTPCCPPWSSPPTRPRCWHRIKNASTFSLKQWHFTHQYQLCVCIRYRLAMWKERGFQSASCEYANSSRDRPSRSSVSPHSSFTFLISWLLANYCIARARRSSHRALNHSSYRFGEAACGIVQKYDCTRKDLKRRHTDFEIASSGLTQQSVVTAAATSDPSRSDHKRHAIATAILVAACGDEA